MLFKINEKYGRRPRPHSWGMEVEAVGFAKKRFKTYIRAAYFFLKGVIESMESNVSSKWDPIKQGKVTTNPTGRGGDGTGQSSFKQCSYDYDFPGLPMGDGQTAIETLVKPSNGPYFTEAFVFQDAGGHKHEL